MATTKIVGLAHVAAQLESARAEMRAAQDRAYTLEEQLRELTGFDLVEGSKTYEDAEDGTKVTLKQPLHRYIDEAAFMAIENELPQIGKDCVRWKADIALRTWRTLEKDYADIWKRMAAECVTTKPGKIQVEVKP